MDIYFFKQKQYFGSRAQPAVRRITAAGGGGGIRATTTQQVQRAWSIYKLIGMFHLSFFFYFIFFFSPIFYAHGACVCIWYEEYCYPSSTYTYIRKYFVSGGFTRVTHSLQNRHNTHRSQADDTRREICAETVGS